MHSRYAIIKAWNYSKQKDKRLKFWKEYIDHDFGQTVFIDEALNKVGKAKQIKCRKNSEKVWNFI